MKHYIIAAIAFVSACVVSRHAHAQMVAQQVTAAIPLDGGTGSGVTTTSAPVLLNYQPFSVTCVLGPNYETVQGIISLKLSGDGVHYGNPTSLAVVALTDGGLTVSNPMASTSAFGPIGNAAGTATVVAASDVFDVSMNPTDPYLYAEVKATTMSDGGSNDAINCYFSIVQTQTLHSPHSPLKAAKPAAPAK